jgi:hypothetical protein
VNLALACIGILIVRSVGGIAVSAINHAIDGVMWLVDGGRR